MRWIPRKVCGMFSGNYNCHNRLSKPTGIHSLRVKGSEKLVMLIMRKHLKDRRGVPQAL